jgi:hypothetical protein
VARWLQRAVAMRNTLASALFLVAACASSPEVATEPGDGSGDDSGSGTGSGDGSGSGSGSGSGDMVADEGLACPSTPTEVTRIVDARVQRRDSTAWGPSGKQGLYTRDVNDDGKEDLLAFESFTTDFVSYQERVRVFLRTDTGFAPPVVTVLGPSGSSSNSVGDFNGDGLLDVLTERTSSGQTVAVVALQQANHSFVLRPGVDVSCSSYYDRLAWHVADLDNDGYDDLIASVAINGLASIATEIAVLRGTATGLASPTCLASKTSARAGVPQQLYGAGSVFADDYDGDGHTDLVAGIDTEYFLFRGTGNLSFVAVQGSAPRAAHIVFRDHIDGRATQGFMRVKYETVSSALTRYTVDATTGISVRDVTPTGMPAPAGYAYGQFTADLNGDGLTDYFGNGHNDVFGVACDRGHRVEAVGGTLPWDVTDARALDYDGDGRDEILAITANDVIVFSLD